MPGVEKPLPEVGNGHATAALIAAVHIALCCRVVQLPRLSAHENIGGGQLAIVEGRLLHPQDGGHLRVAGRNPRRNIR